MQIIKQLQKTFTNLIFSNIVQVDFNFKGVEETKKTFKGYKEEIEQLLKNKLVKKYLNDDDKNLEKNILDTLNIIKAKNDSYHKIPQEDLKKLENIKQQLMIIKENAKSIENNEKQSDYFKKQEQERKKMYLNNTIKECSEDKEWYKKNINNYPFLPLEKDIKDLEQKINTAKNKLKNIFENKVI